MNRKSSNRRAFLKHGALLGGGIVLGGVNPKSVMAEEKPKEAGGEPTQPANETLKSIKSLRTIHGNFLDKEIPEAAQSQRYLDWIFTQWLPYSKPTEQETQILRFIKRSGFMEVQKS
jgi:hypothetical protein